MPKYKVFVEELSVYSFDIDIEGFTEEDAKDFAWTHHPNLYTHVDVENYKEEDGCLEIEAYDLDNPHNFSRQSFHKQLEDN
tara:strand:- start:125 stop:367 length:243 start_codon:yes stop_codon:yes gene_type:complete